MEITKLEQALRLAVQGNKLQPAFAGVSAAEFDKAAQTLASRADKKTGSDILKVVTQSWD